MLNFSPDHLDRYASLDEYAEAKARIFFEPSSTRIAVVVNADDAEALALARRSRASHLLFAMASPLADGSCSPKKRSRVGPRRVTFCSYRGRP